MMLSHLSYGWKFQLGNNFQPLVINSNIGNNLLPHDVASQIFRKLCFATHTKVVLRIYFNTKKYKF